MLKGAKSQVGISAGVSSALIPKAGRIWRGPGTFELPVQLFALNRERLCERLSSKLEGRVVVVLEGGDEVSLYDTDCIYENFRQEAFFMWAFGVTTPGCYGAIDVANKTSYLFIPRLTPRHVIWKGPMHTPQNYIEKYRLHKVHYRDEITEVLRNLNPTMLLTLRGVNPYSNLPSLEARFSGIDKFNINNNILYNEMSDLRVYKTDLEIDLMKYVNNVTSEAHRHVMRFVKPGKTEYQCEAEFLHYVYMEGGCRHAAYPPVCASNGNAAYLHYGDATTPNMRIISPGDLCLFDMGAKYFGYASDITCTFPANGKFSTEQRFIYEIVLSISDTIFKKMKPGVNWVEMHLLGHKILLNELKKGGCLRGDVDQMVTAGLGSIFQPHGLGHLLGLDFHDVGGYIGTKRIKEKGAETLLMTRVLEERMVITLGPGCYFNDYLLDKAMQSAVLSRFIVPDAVKRYRNVGGVRIEDDILIVKTGAINLTKVPRTVHEIEDWIAGEDSHKYT